MKQIIKVYAIISALILFVILSYFAFWPETFASVLEKLAQIYQSGEKLTTIYTYDLTTLENVLTMLFSAYAINILVNIIVLALAYVTEDKFNVRITLYILAINLIFLAIAYSIIKLLAETGVKGISKLVSRRK
ncbi:hypothetical protein KHQ82_02375 [Mycoplasmatota bacterium]|nr:hypothetical protein KHQ82_02375 [Mycoplasmatota bacterium]